MHYLAKKGNTSVRRPAARVVLGVNHSDGGGATFQLVAFVIAA